MAWEWLDTIDGLEGSIAEIGGLNTTWDYALEHIGNPDTYAKQISYSSQYNTPPASISGSEGAFYHDLTTQITKDYTTNWGFTVSFKYLSGSGAGTSGNISWSHDGRSAAISGSNMRSAVRFAVDHERQIAVMILAYYFNVGANYLSLNALWSTYEGQNTAPYLYQLLMEHQPPQYVWSSVPAISGKNGILSLTTLKEESINDGSPVDDATASAFNNAPNSCSVGGIVSVDLPIIDDNPLTIAVKYNIPELTDSVYSSCKVVAKKNKIPKSKTDGDKILDVSPSSHGCMIKGLEQETKYYVVVFVEDSVGNKAESEPGGPVRTGKQSGIFKIRITTSQGVKDNGFKEVIEVTRV